MMSQKSLKGVLELKDKNHFLHCIIIFLPFPLIVVMKNSWDLVLGGVLYNDPSRKSKSKGGRISPMISF